MERVNPAGKLARVVTAVDGESFNELWRQVVARPGAGAAA